MRDYGYRQLLYRSNGGTVPRKSHSGGLDLAMRATMTGAKRALGLSLIGLNVATLALTSFAGLEPVRAASTIASVGAVILPGSTVSSVTALTVTPPPATVTFGSSRNLYTPQPTSSSFSGPSSRSIGAQNAGPAPLGGGGPAVVSISGQPNQVLAISLPSDVAAMASGGEVSVTGFSHNGGMTPSINADGSGSFSITAKVESPTQGDQNGTQGGAQSGSNQGSSQGAGYLNDAVSTQAPHFDVVISYN
jgi:hypothetical protein